MAKRQDSEVSFVTRVVNLPNRSEALQVQRGLLKVIKGPDRGFKKEVQHPGIVVGSSAECDVRLSDEAISRRHFEITPTEGGFVLRDLGSKNGIMVGPVRIYEALLTNGVDFTVGQSKLRFSFQDKHDEFPLSDKSSFGPVLGRSASMRRVFSLLEQVAESEATVLLEGESGTGKDLVAETVHQLSLRAGKPFIVVDCGSMHTSLAESELFGHRKGAFTGAEQDRCGAIEAAQGGTVFLDEIGELNPAVQPKLLRFLEKREIKRLGENSYRPVDVRLIAATNRDLNSEVEAGNFREDLFYRLSVVRVHLPPLRDRREDVGLLARSFVQVLRPNVDPVEIISDQVLSMLASHDWPGNVRELRNVVERILLFPNRPETAITPLGDNNQAGQEDLMGLPFHDARKRWNGRFEKVYLSSMLDACGGVVAQAAQKAGIPRQTFHRLMTKHRLSKA